MATTVNAHDKNVNEQGKEYDTRMNIWEQYHWNFFTNWQSRRAGKLAGKIEQEVDYVHDGFWTFAKHVGIEDERTRESIIELSAKLKAAADDKARHDLLKNAPTAYKELENRVGSRLAATIMDIMPLIEGVLRTESKDAGNQSIDDMAYEYLSKFKMGYPFNSGKVVTIFDALNAIAHKDQLADSDSFEVWRIIANLNDEAKGLYVSTHAFGAALSAVPEWERFENSTVFKDRAGEKFIGNLQDIHSIDEKSFINDMAHLAALAYLERMAHMIRYAYLHGGDLDYVRRIADFFSEGEFKKQPYSVISMGLMDKVRHGGKDYSKQVSTDLTSLRWTAYSKKYLAENASWLNEALNEAAKDDEFKIALDKLRNGEQVTLDKALEIWQVVNGKWLERTGPYAIKSRKTREDLRTMIGRVRITSEDADEFSNILIQAHLSSNHRLAARMGLDPDEIAFISSMEPMAVGDLDNALLRRLRSTATFEEWEQIRSKYLNTEVDELKEEIMLTPDTVA
ncbi:hypothetical protein M1329_00015 [Candidatus Marsarchaeota archaeon]|nr:hypothetical protein [Candidatus Marsarchaeota archaeon]MCL5099937.1 hypothetical protein [Candidatus Marsarchaeota archaeon]